MPFHSFLEAQHAFRDSLALQHIPHEHVYVANLPSVVKALQTCALSYLQRGIRDPPSWGGGKGGGEVPEMVVGKGYRPVEFLARGSAGMVFAAEKDGVKGFVLKRVHPTQYDSAVNEFRIAGRLQGSKRCLRILDCAYTGEKEIWLVLPLIQRTEKYGVDLREYIESGFFQIEENQSHAREIVGQLLEGLRDVSSSGIVMRDVKPDNVLIKQSVDAENNVTYEAFWTDFGLAVDIGPKFDLANIRRVSDKSKNVETDLVGWWYDCCKLVPRPKWKARRPMERGFGNPAVLGGPHTFDAYMLGIIFVCMAMGIDIPHIDKKEIKEDFEKVIGFKLGDDYLDKFELGQSMGENFTAYEKVFVSSFGLKFGPILALVSKRLMSADAKSRPSPKECLEELGIC